MSIVTSIVCNDFALISADTRITYGEPINGVSFDDNAYKLLFVGFGWIGGVGTAQFINLFQHQIKSAQFQNVDDIQTIFNLVYTKIKEQNPILFIENTKVVYSFAYWDEDKLDMHIESLNAVLGRTGIREKNILVSFLPAESPEILAVKSKYTSLIENSKTLDDCIYYNACYIDEVSDLNITVGKICDFGIMIKRNHNTISFVNIKEHVETIKIAYLKKQLYKLYNVIKEITGTNNSV